MVIESPWQARTDGITLRVKASPRASRAAVKGTVALPDGPALAVAISAPPADGAANAALIDALASLLGVPRSAVTLLHGSSGRIKRLHIAGDADALIGKLETLSC
ncbi:MAG: DUF167 domain-containing protein [Sphingopyxis sp.]